MGRFAGAFSRFLFLVLILASVSLNAETKEKPKSWLKSRCARVLIAASLLASTFASGEYHDSQATQKGTTHIGHGIYLNMESVLNRLSSEELDIVSHAEEFPLETTQIFVSYLHGDYGDWKIWPVTRETDAADYLRGGKLDRGVCRHKARILQAVLQRLGVRAHIESGVNWRRPNIWHVWVYLPSLDMIADPTANVIEDRATYLEKYSLVVEGVPLPNGWY